MVLQVCHLPGTPRPCLLLIKGRRKTKEVNKMKMNEFRDELRSFIICADIYSVDENGDVITYEGDLVDEEGIENQMKYIRGKL